MNERKNRGDRSPQRRPAEGVRIIRADEAQAALDAGEAAGRRPDDELRFGDVPPAPPGPRPPHRFPLPDSVDPAGAVPLPPLASPRRSDEYSDNPAVEEADPALPAMWGGQPPATPEVSDPPSEDWGIGERTAELSVPEAAGEAGPTSGAGPANEASSAVPLPLPAEPSPDDVSPPAAATPPAAVSPPAPASPPTAEPPHR